MGSHDPRMLPSQQYGGQPFPLAHPPPQGAGMAAPPFPPYFGAMPPYVAAPPQPFVASSVPLHTYGVPPQSAPIPPLLPGVTTHSETTTATEEYPVSSADDNKISSSNIVCSSTQSPAVMSSPMMSSNSENPPAATPPSKPAKRRFTEKPNVQAEVLKSSLSVNTYTDEASEAPRSVDNPTSSSHQCRVTSQENEVDANDKNMNQKSKNLFALIYLMIKKTMINGNQLLMVAKRISY